MLRRKICHIVIFMFEPINKACLSILVQAWITLLLQMVRKIEYWIYSDTNTVVPANMNSLCHWVSTCCSQRTINSDLFQNANMRDAYTYRYGFQRIFKIIICMIVIPAVTICPPFTTIAYLRSWKLTNTIHSGMEFSTATGQRCQLV